MLEVHRLVAPPPRAPRGTDDLYVAKPSHGWSTAGRRSFGVDSGGRLVLDSYFNSMPVGYWSRWAALTTLQFRGSVRGRGELLLRARDQRGAVREVAQHEVTQDVTAFTLDVTLSSDDVWLWVEVVASSCQIELDDAGWFVDAGVAAPRVGVGITTFNRTTDCLGVLTALAGDLGPVARVVVVDQGDDRLRRHPGYPQVADALGDRLTLVEQPNLGGSGGFARAASDLLRDETVDHIVFLDDDVVLEPEAVRRLAMFARLSGDIVVAGGQMLDLTRPTRLHTTGEIVESTRFWWQTAPGGAHDLDVGESPASLVPQLGRPHEVHFNGWWMCLLPRPVMERAGLPLPLFIKWDDVEYGLRAREAGARVVTFPGAGLWHMPWTSKDTSRDWQAFFLARNRLVAAAMHGRRTPFGLVAHLSAQTLGHIVSMAYSAADLTQAGMEEFLQGPGRLWTTQVSGPRLTQTIRSTHIDADPEAAEEASGSAAPAAPAAEQSAGTVGMLAAGTAAIFHALMAPVPPQVRTVRLPLSEARWRVLRHHDRVLVAGPEGRPSSLRVRDPAKARRLAWRTARNAAVVLVRWRRVRASYRSEVQALTGTAGWSQMFRTVAPAGQQAEKQAEN